MSCPYISVLTVAGPRQGALDAMARALAAQRLPPERFEWVVCLNGADPRDREALQAIALPFTVRLFEADAGPSAGAARNACASRTCGSILLFADAGWRPTPESLAAHVAVQEAGLCLATTRRDRSIRRRAWRAALRGSRAGAWSAPGSAFRAVGGFDEGAPNLHRAESRLRRRLRRAGLPVCEVNDHADHAEEMGDGRSRDVKTEAAT